MFAHRLARDRGWVNVDAMLRTLTGMQLMEHMAYAELEPFGEIRADYRAAQVSQMVFNMAVESKHRKPMKDFVLPTGDNEEAPRPKQDHLAMMKVLAAAYATPPTAAEAAVMAAEDQKMSAHMREQVARAHAAMNAGQGEVD